MYDKLISGNATISVVGLGYVGLPIALAFAKKVSVIGFDINAERINMMNVGIKVSMDCSLKLSHDQQNCRS